MKKKCNGTRTKNVWDSTKNKGEGFAARFLINPFDKTTAYFCWGVGKLSLGRLHRILGQRTASVIRRPTV